MLVPPTFPPLLTLSGGSTPPPSYTGHKYFTTDDRASDGFTVDSSPSAVGTGVAGGLWYVDPGFVQELRSPGFAVADGKGGLMEVPEMNDGGRATLYLDPTGAGSQASLSILANSGGTKTVYVNGSASGTFANSGTTYLMAELFDNGDVKFTAYESSPSSPLASSTVNPGSSNSKIVFNIDATSSAIIPITCAQCDFTI